MSCQEIIIYCVIAEMLTIRNDKFHAGTSRENISGTLNYCFNPHNLSPSSNTVTRVKVKSATASGIHLQMIKIII
jgi:hypothetical protein